MIEFKIESPDSKDGSVIAELTMYGMKHSRGFTSIHAAAKSLHPWVLERMNQNAVPKTMPCHLDPEFMACVECKDWAFVGTQAPHFQMSITVSIPAIQGKRSAYRIEIVNTWSTISNGIEIGYTEKRKDRGWPSLWEVFGYRRKWPYEDCRHKTRDCALQYVYDVVWNGGKQSACTCTDRVFE